MARINRFFRPTVQPEYQPLSLQELAYAPSIQRQREDTLASNINENLLTQYDVLEQDDNFVKEKYSNIQKEYEEALNDLTKEGFNFNTQQRVNKLFQEKRRFENEIASPLISKKQALQSQIKELKEFHKDRPEVAKDAINRLLLNNQSNVASIDPETGELIGTGILDTFNAKVLSTDEIETLKNKALQNINQVVQDLGWSSQPLSNDELTSLITEKSLKGRLPSQVEEALSSLYNSPEVLNSMKMEALAQGLVTENGNTEQDQLVKLNYADNELKKEFYDKLLRSNPTLSTDKLNQKFQQEFSEYSNTDEYLNRIQDIAQNSNSLNIAAKAMINDKILSGVTSYSGMSEIIDRSFQENRSLKRVLDNLDKEETPGRLSSINLGLEPANDFAFEDLILRKDDMVKHTSNYPDINSGDTFIKGYESEYVIVDENGNEVDLNEGAELIKSDNIEGTNVFGLSPNIKTGASIDQYKLKNGYKAVSKQKLQFNKNNDIINNLREDLPELANMSNEQIAAKLQSLKDKNQAGYMTNGLYINDAQYRNFNAKYIGVKNSQGVIQYGQLANQSNYTLTNGGKGKTLAEVADELDYDDMNEFITNSGITKGIFVPKINKWIVQAQVKDSNEMKRIFIEPDNELKKLTEPIKEANDAFQSFLPYSQLSIESENGALNYYTYTDFENGENYVLAVNNNVTVTSREDLKRAVQNGSAKPEYAQTFFTDYYNDIIGTSNEFKDYTK